MRAIRNRLSNAHYLQQLRVTRRTDTTTFKKHNNTRPYVPKRCRNIVQNQSHEQKPVIKQPTTNEQLLPQINELKGGELNKTKLKENLVKRLRTTHSPPLPSFE